MKTPTTSIRIKIGLMLLVFNTILLSSIFAQNDCTSNSTFDPIQEENILIADFYGYTYFVKIYVHVLTHTEKGPGQSLYGVNESLRQIYEVFDPKAIHFVWDGSIDYIVDDDFYNNPSAHTTEISGTNSHADGVDIYLGSDGVNDSEAGTEIVGETTWFIVAGPDSLSLCYEELNSKSNTMAHEMGHVLNLHHTFYDNECLECLYETDPAHNSWRCGDFVFDTPPDPPSQWVVDANCNYIGGGDDPCDNPYQPLTNNYMSYYPISCRDDFTIGQIRRMKNSIELKEELQPLETTDYTYFRGEDLFCNFNTGNYVVYSNDVTTLTLEISPNMAFTSSPQVFTDRIEANVERVNTDIFEGEPGWIVAKRNNIEIARMDFWAGMPQKPLPYSVTGPDIVNYGELHEYYTSNILEGATEIIWELVENGVDEVCDFTNNTSWEVDRRSRYFNTADMRVGECDDEITLKGWNPCGYGLPNEEEQGLIVNVLNSPPTCPDPPVPTPDIIYYPNPADDLLQIDLSLQEYDIFTIKIYDQNSFTVYESESENVVKTVETFSLPNGTYYLHIYDGENLIMNKILIINH